MKLMSKRAAAAAAVCVAASAMFAVQPAAADEVPSDEVAAIAIEPISPAQRYLDTRPGTTTFDGKARGIGRLSPGKPLELQILDRTTTAEWGKWAPVPAGSKGVAVNVTAVAPSDYGHLTVYPCGTKVPLASNLNYTPGSVVPNFAVVGLGKGGKLCIASSAETDVIVDVNGHIASLSPLDLFTPTRLLDTRPGAETADGAHAGLGRIAAGGVYELPVATRSNIYGNLAVLNVTAVAPAADGYLTVFPCGQKRPHASSVNYAAGAVRANVVLAALGDKGRVCIYSSAETDVVVDASGAQQVFGMSEDGGVVATNPARFGDTRPGAGAGTVDGIEARVQHVVRVDADGFGVINGPDGEGVEDIRVPAGGVAWVPIVDPTFGPRIGMPNTFDGTWVNVVAVNPADAGFLSVFGCMDWLVGVYSKSGFKTPNFSTVNYVAGDVVANAAFVARDVTSAVCVYSSAETDIVIDLAGFVNLPTVMFE